MKLFGTYFRSILKGSDMRTWIGRMLFPVALGAVLFSLPACAGWIYDEDDDSESSVDASSYTRWVYVDLKRGTATSVEEYAEDNTRTPPDEWHFALHRWDCKTNGGEVLETSFTTLDELIASGSVPDGDFVADVWTETQIAIDMSGMMDGNIVYAPSYYNPELSKWMNADTSVMPPIYTMNNKVYLLRCADGTLAAIRFLDFVGTTDDGKTDTKGVIRFDYVYPLGFK